MLNYRNTSAVFLILTLVFFISGIYTSIVGIAVFSLLAFIYIFLLTLGASKIQTNFYLKAINRGSKDEAKVALTFDDGPDKEATSFILEVLKKHKIKAAFFCIGNNIENNKAILSRISEEGHLIGNHSWSHAFLFDFYLPSKMARDIVQTDSLIENITGKQSVLFRPPYGVTNPFLSRAIKRTGHQVIGWSLRTFDTSKSKEKVLKRIKNRLKNGDIILLHDANPQTLEILEKIIETIKEKGLEIVGLDELLKLKQKG